MDYQAFDKEMEKCAIKLPENETDIQKFYTGKNIFITGGTGFLGKMLIEKLLWSCADIGNIYLLMREKKGIDTDTRLHELFESLAFVRLKKDRPSFKEKIKIIIGDCALLGLGISAQDKAELLKEVNIVFHVAASVRFHEPLNAALNVNLRATQDMVELSKEMTSLKAFVFVSTAYSHCYKLELDEHFYETPMDPLKLLKFIETADSQIIESISSKLVGKWPNTYSFSKAMTEDYIRQCGVGMPIGIFRPSIVVSSMNEPLPRWVDNWYGVNGYIAACSAGLLRAIRAKSGAEANVVPADLCINGLIAAAWDISERYKEVLAESSVKPTSRDIRIYNFVMTENPITWGMWYDLTSRGGIYTPPMQAIWYRCLVMTSSSPLYFGYKILLHWIPALVFDLGTWCVGKKPQILKMYKRVEKMEDVTMFFTTHSWKFSNHNMLKLIGKMSKEDCQLYPCDMKSVDWSTFLNGYFLGLRRYLLKDNDSTIPAARRKYLLLYTMNRLIQILFFYFTFRGIFKSGKFLYNFINKSKILPIILAK